MPMTTLDFTSESTLSSTTSQWTLGLFFKAKGISSLPSKFVVSYSHSSSSISTAGRERLGRSFRDCAYIPIPNVLLTASGFLYVSFLGKTINLNITTATKPADYCAGDWEDIEAYQPAIYDALGTGGGGGGGDYLPLDGGTMVGDILAGASGLNIGNVLQPFNALHASMVYGTATTAIQFKNSVPVTLTGDVTGTVSSPIGWSIATEIAAGAVGSTELASSAVTAAKIASNAVTNTKLGGNSVTAGKIADGAVTKAKLGFELGDNVFFIVGNDSDTTAGTWTGADDRITAYYDGLTVIFVPAVAGATTTTLNINGLGAKTCYYTNSTKLTTHFSVGIPIMFVFHNDSWRRADYNNDTYTSAFSSTAAATAAKVASCTNFALASKCYVHVLIRYANTAKSALTLNINSTGAKPIYINGVASSSTNYTLPAGTYIAYYDGTNFYFRTDGKLTADITGSAGTATSATGFASAKSIALTGDVTGSATGGNGSNGWSIATEIAAGKVGSTELASSAVTAAKIAAKAVTAAKIADATITAAQIELGTITASQIASGTITGTQIKNGSIGPEKLSSLPGVSSHAMTAYCTTTKNIGSTHSNQTLGGIIGSTGAAEYLQTSGGGIKCLVAGTVLICANVYFHNFNGAMESCVLEAAIKKGTTQLTSATATSFGSYGHGMAISPIVATVAANDIIYLSCQDQMDAGTSILGSDSWGDHGKKTNLTVMYL